MNKTNQLLQKWLKVALLTFQSSITYEYGLFLKYHQSICHMNKPNRLEIYSNDIQKIKNCSSRRAREILKDMKEYYNKERHQIVTPEEAANYLGIKLETLMAFLFSFLIFLSPIIGQDNFWNNVRYFTPEEFYVNREIRPVDHDLVLFLDEVRHELGKPIVITSAVRSDRYNLSVGGVEGSDHTYGKAVDIRIPSSKFRYELLQTTMSLSEQNTQPIKVVLYDNHLHFSLNTSISRIIVH